MNPFLVSAGNPTGCEWVLSGVPCPNGCAPDPTFGLGRGLMKSTLIGASSAGFAEAMRAAIAKPGKPLIVFTVNTRPRKKRRRKK